MIYVPPLLAEMAKWQLLTYARENRGSSRISFKWPVMPDAWVIIVPLLMLALWHGMRVGALPCPQWLPSPDKWLEIGELDSLRLVFHDEYYRVITALGLHLNVSHLAGNLFFGGILLYLLARRTGYGNALLIATIAGAIGNLTSLAFHKEAWLSVGFSTAVFGAAGALAGLAGDFTDSRRKLLLTVGAALGLLALLGSEGENTDYAAHCAGLACGYPMGLYYGWRIRNKHPLLSNFAAFTLTISIYMIAWTFAFSYAME